MILYGSLEIKVTPTSARGFLRPARGYKTAVDPQSEVTIIDNCVERLDSMIKRLTNDKIDRDLTLPKSYEPVHLQAHDTACVIKWPSWFNEAAAFAKLGFLMDWRRSLLEQREIALQRSSEPKTMPLDVLEIQRNKARERKRRSRERQRDAAKLAGTWRPRGRPRKEVN